MCARAERWDRSGSRRGRPIAPRDRPSIRSAARCWSSWWRWWPRLMARVRRMGDERRCVADVEPVGRPGAASYRAVARADRGADRCAGGLRRGCRRELSAAPARADVGRARRSPSDWLAAHPSRRCRTGASAVSAARDSPRSSEGGSTPLSANQPQAHDCFGSQRVERAPAACAPAPARCWIVRAGADVERGAAFRGPALLERGVSVSPRRAARTVRVSGGLQRGAQPHDLRAAGRSRARRGARGGHPAQRGAALGDLAGQPRAAAPTGTTVIAGGGCRCRGRGGRGEHARHGAGCGARR